MKISKNGNDTFIMGPNWDAQARQLKSKFFALTDADLKYVPGRENELLGSVQARLHKTREEVIDILRQLPTQG
jgi:hypothetical protein